MSLNSNFYLTQVQLKREGTESNRGSFPGFNIVHPFLWLSICKNITSENFVTNLKGFNGKEMDNEVSGDGNQYDYGFRIYNPRIGKFLSVDPLTKKYPMLTPFQFASNCPISGVDLDGLEYYYAANGTLLGIIGTSTEVRLVDDKNIKSVQQSISACNTIKAKMNFVEVNNGLSFIDQLTYNNESSLALKNSASIIGMNNEELNMRAMLTVMQKHEGGEGPQRYSKLNGGGTFSSTDNHPGVDLGIDKAAGAYQIMTSSWLDPWTGKALRKKYKIEDFLPTSQDIFTVATIKDKVTVRAFDDVISGNFEGAFKKMANEWRFLPGPKQQGHVKTETLLSEIRSAISSELKGVTKIATPKGKLLNKFKKGN